jgi:uncharacterized protein with HEPN domain
MPSRLPKHLHDALRAAQLAMQFSQGIDDATVYAGNLLVRSAVERQLEILGEACARALADEPDLRERVPEVALAVALRNRVIHGYDRVENQIVFDTVKRDLVPLVEKIEVELARLPPA